MYLGFWRLIALKPAPLQEVGRKYALELSNSSETIEEIIGRDYDLQELQVNMITMSGNNNQTDDEITLFWKS